MKTFNANDKSLIDISINITSILGSGKPLTLNGGNGFIISRKDLQTNQFQTFEVRKHKEKQQNRLYYIDIVEGYCDPEKIIRSVKFDNVDKLLISFPNFLRGEKPHIRIEVFKGQEDLLCFYLKKDRLFTLPSSGEPAENIIIKKGEYLFRKGDTGTNMFIILSGKIGLYTEVGKTMSQIVSLEKNNFFGEMALFGSPERTVAAKAVEDSELCVITKDKLENNLENVPSWFVSMFKTLVNRLKSADNKIETLEQQIIDLKETKNM